MVGRYGDLLVDQGLSTWTLDGSGLPPIKEDLSNDWQRFLATQQCTAPFKENLGQHPTEHRETRLKKLWNFGLGMGLPKVLKLKSKKICCSTALGYFLFPGCHKSLSVHHRSTGNQRYVQPVRSQISQSRDQQQLHERGNSKVQKRWAKWKSVTVAPIIFGNRMQVGISFVVVMWSTWASVSQVVASRWL